MGNVEFVQEEDIGVSSMFIGAGKAFAKQLDDSKKVSCPSKVLCSVSCDSSGLLQLQPLPIVAAIAAEQIWIFWGSLVCCDFISRKRDLKLKGINGEIISGKNQT